MHPWLFVHPPVSTYGTCIVVAIIAAWVLARVLARRRGLDASHVDLLVPLLMAAGMTGAWAFGWWTDRLTDDAAHGIVLAGALVAGTLIGIGYGLVNRIPLGVLGDIFAAPVALAIAGGRVGCFFAGCCYGKVCADGPWAVHFPAGSLAYVDQVKLGLINMDAPQSLPVLPVQLCESAACLLLACLLVLLAARISRGRGISGEAFLALGIGYAVLRFALEFFRADNPPVLGPLTFSQVASIGILLAAGFTGWARRRYRSRWNLHPLMPPPNSGDFPNAAGTSSNETTHSFPSPANVL